MDEPQQKRDPRAPAQVVIYHKRDAARAQLETVILLWFNYADSMSIHTLAAAANKCYHGMGKNEGKPTIIEAWKKSLSRKDYDRSVEAENFAKHANRDADGILHLITEHAELLILDSVVCHERMFQKTTPLMSCFYSRFALENPRFVDHVNLSRREQGLEPIPIEQVGDQSRVEFLDEVLPALLAAARG